MTWILNLGGSSIFALKRKKENQEEHDKIPGWSLSDGILFLVCFLSCLQFKPRHSLTAPGGKGGVIALFSTILRYRTSGAAAAAISLLIGVAPVSAATGQPSKIRLHHMGGSRGRWFSWSEG